MKILIAELKQECATFNPAPTRYEDFSIHVGPAILPAYRSTRTELAGALEVFSQADVLVTPTLAAAAVSGGPIRQADLDRLLQELLQAVDEHADADGIYLCLHGAMAADAEGDPEGRLLTELRRRFPQRPIVASLDLHAVLTDRMLAAADILVPYHTYPHTDHYQTGQRAARSLLGMLSGELHPTVARVPLPMLVRGDELLTASGRFGQAIRMCQELEQSPTGIAAGVIIGNAFTDVPGLQSNVLVTTNHDLPGAKAAAERIGRFMWDQREIFQAELTPLEEAIRQAAETDGLVVFSDAADATASGAAGDSNAILQALLEHGFTKRVLLSIVDEPAVEQAFAAGAGQTIEVSLGGTRDATRFTPLPVTARVTSVCDNGFQYEDGTQASPGRVAVLQCGTITILVTSRPVYVVGRSVFESHGLDLAEFDVVVVKSPNGFRTWYESIAALIVPVDAPGSTSANLRSLPYQHCVRPIFPLDEHVPSPFESKAT